MSVINISKMVSQVFLIYFSLAFQGFWINSVQAVSGKHLAFVSLLYFYIKKILNLGIGYILTYEKVRDILSKNNIHDSRLKGLIAGGMSYLTICHFLII